MRRPKYPRVINKPPSTAERRKQQAKDFARRHGLTLTKPPKPAPRPKPAPKPDPLQQAIDSAERLSQKANRTAAEQRYLAALLEAIADETGRRSEAKDKGRG